jgi:hypothetical protein
MSSARTTTLYTTNMPGPFFDHIHMVTAGLEHILAGDMHSVRCLQEKTVLKSVAGYMGLLSSVKKGLAIFGKKSLV